MLDLNIGFHTKTYPDRQVLRSTIVRLRQTAKKMMSSLISARNWLIGLTRFDEYVYSFPYVFDRYIYPQHISPKPLQNIPNLCPESYQTCNEHKVSVCPGWMFYLGVRTSCIGFTCCIGFVQAFDTLNLF